jgi:uncharacterized protein YcsI (UPF0317 family)
MAVTAQAIQHPARATRAAMRAGAFTGPTAGLAHGWVQGNVAIVPSDAADDFARYCAANSHACPVLAIGRAGDPALPTLGEDIDIRTDLPRYFIYRDGELVGETQEITTLWRQDFVTFVIGCSFTFENALRDAGVPLRHVDQKRNVAMYRTDRATEAVGPFGGALSRCGLSRPPTRIGRPRSAPGFRRCTARRSIAATPRRSASPISRDRTTAKPCRSAPTTCRCSGPAA